MIRTAVAAALSVAAGLIGGAAQPNPVGAARAATPAVVWAVGDGADGSSLARRLARQIERDRPDAFLYLGDVYPSGTAEDYARSYAPVYGGLAGITWPTVGNHDWANRAEGYYPYWRPHGRARPWYRFRIGGWELFALNSEAPHGPGSAQLAWLGRKLAGAHGTCRLAFWHRPRFSAGLHGDSEDVGPFWAALRGHARLILNGHDHDMIRYHRRGGLTEYVAGAGGELRYPVHPDPRAAFARSDPAGALRIRLAPGKAKLTFVSVDGTVLDRSRATCRRR